MSVYERETRIRAPFEEVWDFHSRGEGLEALTPSFMNLRVERIISPDGGPRPGSDSAQLERGSRVKATVRPFGVGPRQGWTSVIVEREEHDTAAMFVDEMEDGPFPYWQHTHSFYADGSETLIRDHVEYELPFGKLGRIASQFGSVGFDPMFRYRHWKTGRVLE